MKVRGLIIRYCLTCMLVLSVLPCTIAQDSVRYEYWEIDNLENIGGHAVSYLGDPQVVTVEGSKAVAFDGDGDRILIDANPIGDAKEFTVEVVFWPEACYPENTDPRFVHIQDPEDPQSKRVLIELRLNEDNLCYMDGFMLTDSDNLALIDETLTHPTETWLHAAVTYKNGLLTTYMQGQEELSGEVGYQDLLLNPVGKTSLGARMDKRNWFRGMIKTLKVTRKALDPADFLIHSPETRVRDIRDATGGIRIYPVPADGHLHVVSGVEAIIRMKDLLGRSILAGASGHNPSSPVLINTSCLNPGIYLLEIQSEYSTVSRSVIIRH